MKWRDLRRVSKSRRGRQSGNEEADEEAIIDEAFSKCRKVESGDALEQNSNMRVASNSCDSRTRAGGLMGHDYI